MKTATGVCDGWGTHHSKTKIPIPTGWGVLEAIPTPGMAFLRTKNRWL